MQNTRSKVSKILKCVTTSYSCPTFRPNYKHCQVIILASHVLALWLDRSCERFRKHPLPTNQLLDQWLRAILPTRIVQPLTFPPHSSNFCEAPELSLGCGAGVGSLPYRTPSSHQGLGTSTFPPPFRPLGIPTNRPFVDCLFLFLAIYDGHFPHEIQ